MEGWIQDGSDGIFLALLIFRKTQYLKQSVTGVRACIRFKFFLLSRFVGGME